MWGGTTGAELTASETTITPGSSSEGTTGSTADDASEGSSSADSTGHPDAMPSAGCGLAPDVADLLVVDGQDRTFVLHLPNDYDPNRAYPLVFAWHARGTSGQIAASYYYVEHAAAESAIFVVTAKASRSKPHWRRERTHRFFATPTRPATWFT